MKCIATTASPCFAHFGALLVECTQAESQGLLKLVSYLTVGEQEAQHQAPMRKPRALRLSAIAPGTSLVRTQGLQSA